MDIAFIMSLAQLPDDKLIKEAAARGIALTSKEIQILRKYLNKASIDWLIFGIPQNVLKELNSQLGSKKVNQLLDAIK